MCQNSTVKLDSDDTSTSADDGYPISQDTLDDVCQKDSASVYLLPLLGGETGSRFRSNKKEEEWKSEMAILGLVLRKEDDIAGHFCRIGMFEFFKNSTPHRNISKERLEPFLEAFKQMGSPVAGSACAEVMENAEHPEEKYVVHLV